MLAQERVRKNHQWLVLSKSAQTFKPITLHSYYNECIFVCSSLLKVITSITDQLTYKTLEVATLLKIT